jgi:hypothetical protein
MKKNMGTTDKTLRILLAVVIAILYFTHIISGTLAIILGILTIISLLASSVSFCPLYVLLGINTTKKKKS